MLLIMSQPGDAGVGDERVEAAEPIDGRLDERADVAGIGDVRGYGDRLSPVAADLRGDGVDPVGRCHDVFAGGVVGLGFDVGGQFDDRVVLPRGGQGEQGGADDDDGGGCGDVPAGEDRLGDRDELAA